MRTAILHRLTLAAMTVVAGGLISATLVRYAPGFGTDERQLDARLSSDSIQAIRNANSEERNILHFYAGCVRRALHGDFGESRSLTEVRHGTAEFCNFWCHQRDKSCLYNRGFRKSGVVQTYPLETSDG